MAKFEKNDIIKGLEYLYLPVGNQWVMKNSFVLNAARTSQLAIGGSIAMAITRKKAIKVPGDIDLFTDDKNIANEFVQKITSYLNNRPNTYYGMMVNHETPYCLEGVSTYMHIQVPFWHKICVMVLKNELRSFIWNKTRVQFFDDVVKAAKKVTEIDGKERVSFQEFIDKDCDIPFDDIVSEKQRLNQQVNDQERLQFDLPRDILDFAPKRVFT